MKLKKANERLVEYQCAAESLNNKLSDHIRKSSHFPVGFASEPQIIKEFDPYNWDHEFREESPPRHSSPLKSALWSPWGYCN